MLQEVTARGSSSLAQPGEATKLFAKDLDHLQLSEIAPKEGPAVPATVACVGILYACGEIGSLW